MATTKTKRVYNKLKRDCSAKHKTDFIKPYQYWGKVVKVVDGDTVDFEIAVGFNILISARVRLIGVDTPEIHKVKRTSKEYAKGRKAAKYVERILPPGKWVELRIFTGAREKYGRWLGEVFVDGSNLNEKLIKRGYAMEHGK